jgi:hypothetical protein
MRCLSLYGSRFTRGGFAVHGTLSRTHRADTDSRRDYTGFKSFERLKKPERAESVFVEDSETMRGTPVLSW